MFYPRFIGPLSDILRRFLKGIGPQSNGYLTSLTQGCALMNFKRNNKTQRQKYIF